MNKDKLPDKCAACGAEIEIAVNCDDQNKAGWSCTKCNAFGFADYDHPEITQGIEMAAQFKGVHCMDKRITSLPGRVQLGILRRLQSKN